MIRAIDLCCGAGGWAAAARGLPCREEFLESCRRYFERRRAPHDMNPPPGQMTIGQLEAEVERLKEFEAMYNGLCK